MCAMVKTVVARNTVPGFEDCMGSWPSIVGWFDPIKSLQKAHIWWDFIANQCSLTMAHMTDMFGKTNEYAQIIVVIFPNTSLVYIFSISLLYPCAPGSWTLLCTLIKSWIRWRSYIHIYIYVCVYNIYSIYIVYIPRLDDHSCRSCHQSMKIGMTKIAPKTRIPVLWDDRPNDSPVYSQNVVDQFHFHIMHTKYGKTMGKTHGKTQWKVY